MIPRRQRRKDRRPVRARIQTVRRFIAPVPATWSIAPGPARTRISNGGVAPPATESSRSAQAP
jgi:hypothetical protein